MQNQIKCSFHGIFWPQVGNFRKHEHIYRLEFIVYFKLQIEKFLLFLFFVFLYQFLSVENLAKFLLQGGKQTNADRCF